MLCNDKGDKEMSKALEALERYGYHCNHYVNGEKDYHIIETALKRLETLEEEKQSFDRQLEKKLKALEIIKEKNVNVKDLQNVIRYKMAYPNHQIKEYIYYNSLKPEKERLTEEEYDLLKEVLL